MNSSLPAARPLEIYDSARQVSPAWNELQQVWQYRSLLALLIVNSFRSRYRRSALGIVWIFLYPVMNMAVLSIAFSAVFRERVRDYPVYVLVGFLVWHCFTNITTTTVHSTISGNGLARRIALPRTIFLLADAAVSAINLTLGLIPLALIMLMLELAIPITWLLFPFVLVFLLLFTLGVGMLVAVLAVYYGDVAHMYDLFLPALFFLTPIVYPITILPEPFRGWIAWNPLWGLVQTARGILTDGQLPALDILAGAIFVSSMTFALGWWLYTRRAPHFVYYLS